MFDQAARLRQLMNEPVKVVEKSKNTPRILTVASGKGGVGKTNFVCNLAICLAQQKKRVIIFDADLGMANIDVILGVVSRYSLYDVIQGRKKISEIVISGPENIKIVPEGTGVEELADLDHYQRQRLIDGLKEISLDTDYIIIDTGAGISKNVLSFVSAADDVIIVFTPEPTAITDAYGIIKVISTYRIHPQVFMVVNRVSNDAEAKNSITKMENATKKFLNIKVNPLGYIYDDRYVYRSVMNQVPFVLNYPDSKASKNIKKIALDLKNGECKPPKGTNGFINKLLSLLSR